VEAEQINEQETVISRINDSFFDNQPVFTLNDILSKSHH
jgi:hypothetical protein